MGVNSTELWTLFSHIVIATFFMMTFTRYYLALWHRAFRLNKHNARAQIIDRVGLMAFSFGLGMFLYAMGRVVLPNAVFYQNLSLFVFAVPLFDEDINFWEYILRCIGMVIIWCLYHKEALLGWPSLVSLVVLGVLLILIQQWQHRLRGNVWLTFFVYGVMALGFWLTVPTEASGTLIVRVAAWQGLLMFLLLALATSLFWRWEHAESVHNDSITRMADYDALTNAKSYSLYQREMTDAFAYAHVHQVPLTAVALDVDHFKMINDRFGHLAGNVVLVGLATILRDTLRQQHVPAQVYRTGGEEFIIVFNHRAPQSALPATIACWRAVRTHVFRYVDKEIHVTISIGITSVQDTDVDMDDAYRRADESLYVSKRNGRDTITVDGEVQNLDRGDDVSKTYAYFVQGVYDINQATVPRVCNELTLYEYSHQQERWLARPTMQLPVAEMVSLVKDVLANTAVRAVALSITPEAFTDATTLGGLIRLAGSADGPETLFLELTRLPAVASLRQAIAQCHQADINVVYNHREGEGVAPHMHEVVHEFDAIKETLVTDTVGTVHESVKRWSVAAQSWGVPLILNGVVNEEETQWAHNVAHVRYLQGIHFTKPELPVMK